MELEEAIKILKEDLEHTKKANECGLATKGEFNKEIEAIEFILNHLDKQEKMIELMSKRIRADDIDEDICQYQGICNEYECEECIKQYFEKKANEEDNSNVKD